MAVTLRLRRMGRSKRPLYALIAADSRSPRDGRYIEDLGRYDAIAEPAVVKLNRERVLYWLSQGAQTTDTARSLLSREGLLLESTMQRRGKSPEDVQQAVAAHQAARAGKVETKITPAVRKAQALEAEAESKRQAEAKAARAAEAEAAAAAAAEGEAAAAAEGVAEEAPAAETPAAEAPAAEGDSAAPAEGNAETEAE